MIRLWSLFVIWWNEHESQRWRSGGRKRAQKLSNALFCIWQWISYVLVGSGCQRRFERVSGPWSMNSRSLTCVYPETRPDVLSYRGNGVEGVGATPWPGGNRIAVRARLYDYTSCPGIRIVFRAQLRQIHPVAVATMGISKLRKLFRHLLPPLPWPPPVTGDFLLSLMTNYGKFLTLQTATHKTHTKLTIAMSSLTPPCHIGGFFRLSWLSFADGYGRLEKSAFVVLSPK